MTGGTPWPTTGGQAWRVASVALLRATLSVAAMVAAYFLVPTRAGGTGSDWPWVLLAVSVFGVIVGIQVPAIVKAEHPVLRALESLAILLPAYLLIFARIYLSTSLTHASAFSQPLTAASALYFTVSVFASVGFGDIVAHTDSVRLLVTVQMLLNLVVFGVVIRLVVSAARRGIARRGDQPPP
jgi:voltage-gated potassium channel